MKLDPEHRKPCSSCAAPIVWATMATGERKPVDFEPSEGANVVLFDGPNGVFGVVVHGTAFAHKPRHRSHFATCPHADERRRKLARSDEERCSRKAVRA